MPFQYNSGAAGQPNQPTQPTQPSRPSAPSVPGGSNNGSFGPTNPSRPQPPQPPTPASYPSSGTTPQASTGQQWSSPLGILQRPLTSDLVKQLFSNAVVGDLNSSLLNNGRLDPDSISYLAQGINSLEPKIVGKNTWATDRFIRVTYSLRSSQKSYLIVDICNFLTASEAQEAMKTYLSEFDQDPRKTTKKPPFNCGQVALQAGASLFWVRDSLWVRVLTQAEAREPSPQKNLPPQPNFFAMARAGGNMLNNIRSASTDRRVNNSMSRSGFSYGGAGGNSQPNPRSITSEAKPTWGQSNPSQSRIPPSTMSTSSAGGGHLMSGSTFSYGDAGRSSTGPVQGPPTSQLGFLQAGGINASAPTSGGRGFNPSVAGEAPSSLASSTSSAITKMVLDFSQKLDAHLAQNAVQASQHQRPNLAVNTKSYRCKRGGDFTVRLVDASNLHNLKPSFAKDPKVVCATRNGTKDGVYSFMGQCPGKTVIRLMAFRADNLAIGSVDVEVEVIEA